MRLFTAIPFPEEKKDLAGRLFRGRLPVAYVNTENLHITLNFLGEVEDVDIATLKRVCGETLLDKPKVSIEFDRIVKFHQQLHLTLKHNQPLCFMQERLERNLFAAGFRFPDRQYYPHVKLANMHMDKVMNPQHRLDNFSQEEIKSLDFLAEKAALFESKLLMHHAKHTLIEEYQLI